MSGCSARELFGSAAAHGNLLLMGVEKVAARDGVAAGVP